MTFQIHIFQATNIKVHCNVQFQSSPYASSMMCSVTLLQKLAVVEKIKMFPYIVHVYIRINQF